MLQAEISIIVFLKFISVIDKQVFSVLDPVLRSQPNSMIGQALSREVDIVYYRIEHFFANRTLINKF